MIAVMGSQEQKDYIQLRKCKKQNQTQWGDAKGIQHQEKITTPSMSNKQSMWLHRKAQSRQSSVNNEHGICFILLLLVSNLV